MTAITPDQMAKLDAVCKLAGAIVLETPPRKNTFTPNAYVRRDLIEQLEAALVAVGYDMAAARERYRAKMAEAKKAKQ